MNVNKLLGKTLTEIIVDKDKEYIIFNTEYCSYKMYHAQDCCESVEIESIVGDIQDLIGSPILLAEEVTNSDEYPVGVEKPECCESFTWTFYKFATRKGYVDIRWFGESNGYYSESVNFAQLDKDEDIDYDTLYD